MHSKGIMGNIAAAPNQRATRDVLVGDINLAFNRVNIQATAARLATVATTGDFLDICDHLGFLQTIHGGNLVQYKRNLAIPEVNRQLLTAAFRASLTAAPDPIPLQILISSGSHDIVTVTVTDAEVSVIVVRADIAGAGTRKQAARKTAAGKR
ncbi:MAG: hypothetical protein ACREF3_16880 [Acetobacteraceae bacterium]